MAHTTSRFHRRSPRLRCTALAAAAFVASAASWAQPAPQAGSTQATLPAVTVIARPAPSAGVAGFGSVPLADAPFQASVIDADHIKARGVQRIADLARIDPAVSDAYNAEGYWDSLTVRGYAISNRYNFRRDGLPINAETSIPLDNKERIELLKGTSGIQAGTSAPGGLVNLVVKRPTTEPLRSATLGWRERGSVLGAIDLSQRFGDERQFGLRLNAAHERLNPKLDSARGKRQLVAIAGDWRLTRDTLVEVEAETSHRSQPSQPAFSLLGSSVPAPVNSRINLNNQWWSQPVEMDANTASLRVTHKLDSQWRLTAHGVMQRLRTDDRLAFPFGCDAEGNYDRYCSDGSFDLYDFRSENERRRSDAVELAAHGDLKLGGVGHKLSFGVLEQRTRVRLEGQAYNYAGAGNVGGTAVTPASPLADGTNTNRDERSTELFVRDAVSFTKRLTGWFGLRHMRVHRDSIQTNDSDATSYGQSFTTPWVAASYKLDADQLAYASWGQGIESDVAPSQPAIANHGQALGPLKSRQFELGYKAEGASTRWGVALFRIERPVFALSTATSAVQADGEAVHQGIETTAGWRSGSWRLQGGLQALHARRSDSEMASVNGQRPTNVPALALRLQTNYAVSAVPGLDLQANALADSDRMVLEDNSARIGGYGRIDLGGAYTQRTGNGSLVWRAGVDNLLDRRAWRESPFQYGHAYLYPLAARTFRVSIEASL
jgi:iron complex outermembrane receptor protein